MPTFRGYSRLMQLAGVDRPDNPVVPPYIEVNDITSLTTSQLDSLKVGDLVVKITGNEKHGYHVSYKDSTKGELSLVYADHSNVEEVYFEKVEGVWTYIITENTHIGS